MNITNSFNQPSVDISCVMNLFLKQPAQEINIRLNDLYRYLNNQDQTCSKTLVREIVKSILRQELLTGSIEGDEICIIKQ